MEKLIYSPARRPLSIFSAWLNPWQWSPAEKKHSILQPNPTGL